jgi:predicted lipoprotein
MVLLLKKIIITVIAAVVIIGYIAATTTIVKTGQENLLTGEAVFNPGDSVAAIWDTQAIPDLSARAVDLKQFLEEANGDLKSLADKYGKYSMGTSGELSYTVKGTATVKAVNTEKKAGFMEVALKDYTGAETIKLQIGNVYKGSAVRDSLSFIRFEDYTNQVDYAAISQSIHNFIQENVINKIDLTTIEGKEIEFMGCFTVSGNDELLITPVTMTVK